MAQQNLVLRLPEGTITATSLGIEGLAHHRSPGSGRFFAHRTLLFDLAVANGRPDFTFLDEGGWRDAARDTAAALEAVATEGKRTKTALSNNAFSCTPVDAFRRGFLVKTGGETLELQRGETIHRFAAHDCNEKMTPDQVANAVGLPKGPRMQRLYMVLCPVQILMLSNLSPVEYAWYATHRPGKIFRQVLFAELRNDQPQLAAESVFQRARQELANEPVKKTKTIITEETINRVLYADWVGYEQGEAGGAYVADPEHVVLWRFPAHIPRDWDRLEG